MSISALSFEEISLKNDHHCGSGVGGDVSINGLYQTIFSKVLYSALCSNPLPSSGKPCANIF